LIKVPVYQPRICYD